MLLHIVFEELRHKLKFVTSSIALETLLHELLVGCGERCKAQVVVILGVGFLEDNDSIRRLHVLELLLADELNDIAITFPVDLTFRQWLQLAHLLDCPLFDGSPNML